MLQQLNLTTIQTPTDGKVRLVEFGAIPEKGRPLGLKGGNDPSIYPPVAIFVFTANILSVAFDASESFSLFGEIVSYQWVFGDGTTGTGKTPSHDYPDTGDYVVGLTVTSAFGKTGYTERIVKVVSDYNPPIGDPYLYINLSHYFPGRSMPLTNGYMDHGLQVFGPYPERLNLYAVNVDLGCDLVLDGEVFQPGMYPFDWTPYNSNPPPGANGPHIIGWPEPLFLKHIPAGATFTIDIRGYGWGLMYGSGVSAEGQIQGFVSAPPP